MLLTRPVFVQLGPDSHLLHVPPWSCLPLVRHLLCGFAVHGKRRLWRRWLGTSRTMLNRERHDSAPCPTDASSRRGSLSRAILLKAKAFHVQFGPQNLDVGVAGPALQPMHQGRFVQLGRLFLRAFLGFGGIGFWVQGNLDPQLLKSIPRVTLVNVMFKLCPPCFCAETSSTLVSVCPHGSAVHHVAQRAPLA